MGDKYLNFLRKKKTETMVSYILGRLNYEEGDTSPSSCSCLEVQLLREAVGTYRQEGLQAGKSEHGGVPCSSEQNTCILGRME